MILHERVAEVFTKTFFKEIIFRISSQKLICDLRGFCWYRVNSPKGLIAEKKTIPVNSMQITKPESTRKYNLISTSIYCLLG
jgi:hypothetical protein